MQIDILTLFPDMIRSASGYSILGRAQKNGLMTVNAVDIRDYTVDKQPCRESRSC